MRPPVRWFFVLAGAGDAVTGLLLLLHPAWTLAQMGVRALPAEPVYVRFLGAFVAGVGLSYLAVLLPVAIGRWPAARDRDRRAGAEQALLLVTAIQRGAVSLFVAAAVLGAALTAPWWTVALYDGALAAAQGTALAREGRRRRAAAIRSAEATR